MADKSVKRSRDNLQAPHGPADMSAQMDRHRMMEPGPNLGPDTRFRTGAPVQRPSPRTGGATGQDPGNSHANMYGGTEESRFEDAAEGCM